jgi:hypothetical protein
MAHCLGQCSIDAHHNVERRVENGISMAHQINRDMER